MLRSGPPDGATDLTLSTAAAVAGAGPVAAGQVIGLYLRRLRNDTGLPVKDVTAKADMSVAKLSRLERGVNPPKAKDVFAVMQFFGVTDEVELAALEHLLAQTLKSEWWQEFSDVVPGWLSRLLATKSAATEIRTYQCHYVPGLLQTPEYARAVVQSAYDDPAE
ncbi:Scr1 family TA system antitoxin-like transcriptional regulator [Streptomyces sp. NPDC021224]|uniref:Scr1 family TA system antitoxin-like transcriptional regulator n=1 Tax=unclassified Streptomyces TaxID=2593676 RepID=UPI0037A561D4